ncbi:MAG: hypothetical protein JST67_01830 [Bacteroidetes bacterium]|nr:hypothetical protein [Bacteroidota bacterium]
MLLLLLLLLLSFPYIQKTIHLFDLKPLKGAIIIPEESKWSIESWFLGTYQEQQEKYINETFGARSLFIRINNQIAFSLFKKAKANGVLIGKENYLYEEAYIKAYYGTDFVGEDSITHIMQRLKFIQDTLHKLNKNLILAFAAGKGTFYPEYFPENRKTKKGKTNHQTYIKLAKQLAIDHIDFNTYFAQQKNKSKYPLYTQYGIHWSYYGSCIAADSLIRFMEKKRNIDMPNLFWNKVEICQPKDGEYDVADGMNILFKLKSFDMAWPEVQFQSDSGKIKPSVLVVSDSYYWGIFNFGISKVFDKSHFWYYNRQIYPDSYIKPLDASEVNLQEEISKHDVFIIMATEATLPTFGWGFIENMYYTLKGENTQKKFKEDIEALKKRIKADEKWMRVIEEKAKKNNISVDSMLASDAKWVIQNIKK